MLGKIRRLTMKHVLSNVAGFALIAGLALVVQASPDRWAPSEKLALVGSPAREPNSFRAAGGRTCDLQRPVAAPRCD